jgi:hypothetical protein
MTRNGLRRHQRAVLGVKARLCAAVARRLGCRAEQVAILRQDMVNGWPTSVYGVPADKVQAAREAGLLAEVRN